MKTYTVNQISKMLGTSQETVRRWIRSGELKADRGASKKEGNVIKEDDFREFLRNHPKYDPVSLST